MEELTPLEPPYRYNRVTVENDGSVKAHGQNASFGALHEKVQTLEDGTPPVQVSQDNAIIHCGLC